MVLNKKCKEYVLILNIIMPALNSFRGILMFLRVEKYLKILNIGNQSNQFYISFEIPMIIVN